MRSSTSSFSVVLLGVILLGFTLGYAYFLNEYTSAPYLSFWIHEYVEQKERIALEKPSPKLVIVAGSNALYSISAEMIEKDLGIPTVNLASTSDLGDYIFERAERVLKPGDAVLMPLEYGYYAEYRTKRMYEGQWWREQYMLAWDRDHFDSLSFVDQLNALLIDVKDLSKEIYYHDAEHPPFDLVIDDWGDTTNNEREINFTPIKIKFPNNFNLMFDRGFFSYGPERGILKFADWCREHNVTLIASYPSALYNEDYHSPSYQRSFRRIEEFYHKRGILTLGKPEDFIFPDGLFYNTDYHLNFRGRQLQTIFIIKELKPILEENNLFQNSSFMSQK